MKSQKLITALKWIIVFLLYFITGKLGLKINAVSGFATLIWPPSGIALASVLLIGYRVWPAVFLAAFWVNYQNGAPLLVALGIATGNTLEPLLGAYLFLKVAKGHPSLERFRDVLSFLILPSLGSTLISASLGVTALKWGDLISHDQFWHTWRIWWMGDILGDLIIASFFLCWSTQSKASLKSSHYFELGTLLFFAVLTNLLVFGGEDLLSSHVRLYGLPYMIMPIVIWTALRFGQRGASAITLVGRVPRLVEIHRRVSRMSAA